MAIVAVAVGINNLFISDLVFAATNTSPVAKTAVSSATMKMYQPVVAIFNSFYSANLTPEEIKGTKIVGFSSTSSQTLVATWDDINVSIHSNSICKYPISIKTAQWMVKHLADRGINASSIISSSTTFIFARTTDIQYPISNILGRDAAGNPLTGRDIGTQGKFGKPFAGYCLDAGYVSNYPNYVNKFTAFLTKYNMFKLLLASSTIKPTDYFPFAGLPAYYTSGVRTTATSTGR